MLISDWPAQFLLDDSLHSINSRVSGALVKMEPTPWSCEINEVLFILLKRC